MTALCVHLSFVAALACAAPEGPAAAASPEQVQQSVARSIAFLEADAVRWMNEHNCNSCHHAPMMIWSLNEAQRQGYTINADALARGTNEVLGGLEQMIKTGVLRDPAQPPSPHAYANAVRMGAVFVAVGADAMPSHSEIQKDGLDLITKHILEKQREDGSWEFFGNRPPIAESQATDAAWIVLALEAAANRPGASESTRAALDKAKAWLAAAKLPDSHQAKVLALLLAIRGGQPRERWQPLVDQLLALEKADGGWSQTPDMASDGLATGQTLYALTLAGVDRGRLARGVAFLVSAQKDDGSWPMASRPTLDGKGGPCDYLVPITYAGSAWATLGLLRATPHRP
jgi:hypothetical protein